MLLGSSPSNFVGVLVLFVCRREDWLRPVHVLWCKPQHWLSASLNGIFWWKGGVGLFFYNTIGVCITLEGLYWAFLRLSRVRESPPSSFNKFAILRSPAPKLPSPWPKSIPETHTNPNPSSDSLHFSTLAILMSESSPPLDFIQKSVTAPWLNPVAHITNKVCSRAHPPAILVLSRYRCSEWTGGGKRTKT